MEVAKSTSGSCGAEFVWFNGFFPGAAEVLGVLACEGELGVSGNDELGPGICRVWGHDLWCGPAEGLFEESEAVFQVEAA